MGIGGACAVQAARPSLTDIRERNSREAFRWAPEAKAAQAAWQNRHSSDPLGAKAPVSTPDQVLPSSESYAYLDMPDGKTWFATVDFEKEVFSQSAYYTDWAYTGVEISIYNENYQKVGYIHDSIELPEGFERCSNAEVGACVSRKFFNSDDNYEVMLMLNFKPEGEPGAVAFTNVYSLKGPDTAASRLLTIPGYYTVAINNAADAWSEDFYMEFFTSETYTEDEMIFTFDIFGKAGWGSDGPARLMTFPVNMLYVMSDGENEGVPVMLNSRGRDLYVTLARYEKTFFEDPFDFTNDNLNPDNKFLIDLYTKIGYASALTKAKTIEIPCQEPGADFAMRSYSLGQFQAYEDITFDFSEDGNPAFIVTEAQSDYRENVTWSYNVYDYDGNKIKTFGEATDGYLRLSSVKGAPEQFCFISYDNSGLPVYSIMNYPSLTTQVEIPAYYDDGEVSAVMSMTLDRAPVPGGYNYVFAASRGESDDQDNTLQPVYWFDNEGLLLHVDNINGGKNINLIKPFIAGYALDPYLFNTDAAREYMVLIQRQDYAGSNAAHTELCIINDKGDMLVQWPFEKNDAGISISLVNTDSNPAIWISWEDAADKLYHNEFIKLPLNKFEGTGTKADPYLVYTPGDFNQIRFNLAGHFRLANDIDFSGVEVASVSGTLTGGFDGAGHTIKNITLEDKAIFQNVGLSDLPENVYIKDLTLSGVTVEGDAEAILAETSYCTTFSNVHIHKALVSGSNDADFGTMVNLANSGTVISECSASVEIDLPDASNVGGLVSTLGGDARIEASYVTGSVKADSEVGGIAGTLRNAQGAIVDCHVDAVIEARNLIGGVVASSERGVVERCIVEGEITATEAGFRYDADYNRVPVISVGGVVGHLKTKTANPESDGGDASIEETYVVKGCVVGLDAITIPSDEPRLLETAHRIVGRSSINDDPEILDEIYNEDTGEWEIVWGDPAGPEPWIADNYALSDLQLIHGEVADDAATTEGKSIEFDEADGGFFTGLGYGFHGYEASAPWVSSYTGLPDLHFEKNIGASISFDPAEMALTVGEKKNALLVLEGVEFDALTFEFSDEENLIANPVEFDGDGNVIIEVEVMKEGTYTLTVTNGSISATLTIYGTSGIANVSADDSGLSYDGGVVVAQGCGISLFDMAGVRVASGHSTLSTAGLPAGIYMAVAVTADGSRSTLKIAVK